MPSLPVDGATGWGDTLNAYLAALQGEADSTQSGLNSHAANSPSDPHGDRSYAQSLVTPITTGVNGVNGYVQNNSLGVIPANLIQSKGTGGMYRGIIDAVAMYGATPNNGADQSAAINSALTAAGSAGGGIVYLGPGVFSLSSQLTMKSNTWLLMSSGTTLRRIPGSPNTTIMISNIAINTGATPATNIMISGGTIDMNGTAPVTSACTGIFLFKTFNAVVTGTRLISPFNAGPAIEVNASSGVRIDGCQVSGIVGISLGTFPVFRLNTASTSTTIAGLNPALYDNAACFSISIVNNLIGSELDTNSSAVSPFGWVAGSDKQFVSAPSHQMIVIANNISYYLSSAAAAGDPIKSIGNWESHTISGNDFIDVNPTDWTLLSLSNGFTAGTTGFPPQYRITDDGYMQIYGSFRLPSVYNGVAITTMTVNPAHTVVSPVSWTTSTAVSTSPTAQVNTSGTLTFNNLPSGMSGINIFVDMRVPVLGSRISI